MPDSAGLLDELDRGRLVDILADARSRHFLGHGPVASHLDHSLSFATLVSQPPNHCVDLGSGGGVPGLVLALLWPMSTWVLLDANRRRTEFLFDAVKTLGLADRVDVVNERAELVGHDPEHRSRADLVVARSFGTPAVTAECAAPLLRPDGLLIVAEPPGGDPLRWPAEALSAVGLVPRALVVSPVALQSLRQVAPCPPRYPRRTGIPEKRPLF